MGECCVQRGGADAAASWESLGGRSIWFGVVALCVVGGAWGVWQHVLAVDGAGAGLCWHDESQRHTIWQVDRYSWSCCTVGSGSMNQPLGRPACIQSRVCAPWCDGSERVVCFGFQRFLAVAPRRGCNDASPEIMGDCVCGVVPARPTSCSQLIALEPPRAFRHLLGCLREVVNQCNPPVHDRNPPRVLHGLVAVWSAARRGSFYDQQQLRGPCARRT